MDTSTLILNATIFLVVGALLNRVSRGDQATHDVAVEASAPVVVPTAPSRDKAREPRPQVYHRLSTRPLELECRGRSCAILARRRDMVLEVDLRCVSIRAVGSSIELGERRAEPLAIATTTIDDDDSAVRMADYSTDTGAAAKSAAGSQSLGRKRWSTKRMLAISLDMNCSSITER